MTADFPKLKEVMILYDENAATDADARLNNPEHDEDMYRVIVEQMQYLEYLKKLNKITLTFTHNYGLVNLFIYNKSEKKLHLIDLGDPDLIVDHFLPSTLKIDNVSLRKLHPSVTTLEDKFLYGDDKRISKLPNLRTIITDEINYLTENINNINKLVLRGDPRHSNMKNVKFFPDLKELVIFILSIPEIAQIQKY